MCDRCDIRGETRCEGARIREFVVITSRKRRTDLLRGLLADIREDVIVTKGITEVCDHIAPHVAVDSGGEVGSDCVGAAAIKAQERSPRNVRAEWRIAYPPVLINSGAHSVAPATPLQLDPFSIVYIYRLSEQRIFDGDYIG